MVVIMRTLLPQLDGCGLLMLEGFTWRLPIGARSEFCTSGSSQNYSA